jgi:hypothetical protein
MKKRFIEAQIIGILEEAQVGVPLRLLRQTGCADINRFWPVEFHYCNLTKPERDGQPGLSLDRNEAFSLAMVRTDALDLAGACIPAAGRDRCHPPFYSSVPGRPRPAERGHDPDSPRLDASARSSSAQSASRRRSACNERSTV